MGNSIVIKARTGFDPYQRWLGIRYAQRPLNPYQFLNLEPGEKDIAKIESAANAQRRLLARYRTQADEELWRTVHLELEEAIATLLDPHKKSGLDQSLGVSRNARSDGMNPSLIECTVCEHGNSNERRFCSSCGASLWQTCLKCSTEWGVHESFCGKCGSHLRQLVREHVTEFQNQLNKAREFRAEFKFSEALNELRAIPEPRTAIPERLIEEWEQLRGEIDADQKRWTREQNEAIEEAEKLSRSHQYKEVIQRLREIPPAMLNQRSRQLIDAAGNYLEEIKKLRADIAADVEARRLLQLGPKIERYLTLQPHEEKIRELGRKVSEHVCKRVKEAIAGSDYTKAQQLLEHVPLSGRTDEVQKLSEHVSEVHRLYYEIRNAAVVDASLLSIADRLMKVVPEVEGVAKALEAMQVRLRQPPSDVRFPLISWAPIPKRTTLGIPVDVLGGFRRIGVTTPEVAQILRKSPGAHFVACGLALQGLGKSQLSTSLGLEKTEGLFSKISLFKNKKPPTAAWGIDLGGSCLKAVRMVLDAKTGNADLTNCDVIPYQMNLSHPEAEKLRSEIIQAALRTFWEKHSPRDDEALISNSPNAKTLVRVFNVPFAKEAKLAEIINHEVTHQIPFPLNEMTWSYGLFDAAKGSNGANGTNDEPLQRVVVIALRTQDLVTRAKDFEFANARTPLFQADCVALHNFLAYDEFNAFSTEATATPPDRNKSIALLDIGSDCCNLVFTSPRSVWFRIFRAGGNDINQVLARDLKITFAQAEDLKRNPGKVARIRPVLNSIEPALVRIGSEIQRTLDLFAKENPEKQVERMWLCGGAATQFGLLRSLRTGSPPNS